MSTRILSAADAAREGLEQMLGADESCFVIGEGVPDPKACFGTTKGLKEKYPNQVFDMPVSENGMTGVCIGAAIQGLKPVMIHMRQDFLLYAMDQIVNNAAKWHSMYGGNGGNVPMVIKAFTGRGWGAGHQHAQNLASLFAHIPGLKVVAPSTAQNAKGLLVAAIRDPNPVLILEHRWVHNLTGDVPEEIYETPIGKADIVQVGRDVTLVAWSFQAAEARIAARALGKLGVSVELIDMQTLRPMDLQAVYVSVVKTGRLVVVDEAWNFGSLSAEILAYVAASGAMFEETPKRITNPSFYPSSTPALTKGYYPDWVKIFNAIAVWFDIEPLEDESNLPHDIPDPSFKGPF